MPDAQYSDTPIPHFTHNGTGYQLLNNLAGRSVSVITSGTSYLMVRFMSAAQKSHCLPVVQ